MGALLFRHLHYGRVVSTAALVSTADRSSPTVEKPVVVDRQIAKDWRRIWKVVTVLYTAQNLVV